MKQDPSGSNSWLPPSDIPSSLYREYEGPNCGPMPAVEVILHIVIAIVLVGLGVYGHLCSFSFI
jgi:hypothetical protein